MNKFDWLVGLALAGMFAPLFGMIGNLFVSAVGPSKPYVWNEPLITKSDIRIATVIALAIAPILIFAGATLSKKDRENAASWERYIREHRCAVVDSRIRTEYLWRCDNGEQWRR